MEIKEWTYKEFPDYSEQIEGAIRISTSGDEVGVRFYPDITYVNIEGVDLHLQILEPFTRNEPDRIYPCLVYIQGSAWMKQEVAKKSPMLAKLAKRGYVIAIVEYRHSEMAPFPAQIQDARNAIRYMRVHAAEYHVDAANMFAGGDSSGGHTAVFCGLIKEGDEMDASAFPGVSAKVNGILDYYGAVNLLMEDGFPSTVNHHLPDSPEGMLLGGCNLREDRETCKKATAECYITPETEIAPVFIVHGTKDRTVNVKQSVSLYQKLKECGKTASLYLLEEADHGGAEFWEDNICNEADTFLKGLCN